MTRAKDISKIVTDADLSGTLDVTGAVTAGGLTMDTGGNSTHTLEFGANRTSDSQALGIIKGSWNSTVVSQINLSAGDDTTNKDNGQIFFRTAEAGTTANRLRIEENGDISFYEDTGTTPKLFWDASAESLGIGTSSPYTLLELSSTDPILRFNDSNGGTDTKNFEIRYVGTSSPDIDGLYFRTVNDANSVYSDKMVVLGSGNVGIGTSSPLSTLVVGGNANTTAKPTVAITDTTSGATLSMRGQSPKIAFDVTSSGVPKILMDNAGLEFKTGTLDAEGDVDVKIDSSGNVGINETSPLGKLHVKSGDSGASVSVHGDELVVEGSANSGISILSGNSNTGVIYFGDDGDNNVAEISYDHSANAMKFFTSASERMRIDSSGNLLVATTDTNPGNDSDASAGLSYNVGFGGQLILRATANNPLMLNRTTSDGDIISLRKNGTDVGMIGTFGSAIYIASPDGTDAGLRLGNRTVLPVTTTGALRDNQIDLGSSSARFQTLYATTSSINTSDKNEKNTITDSDLGIDFIKRLTPKSYIFNGRTRTHYGLIAQDVETVLTDINKPTSGFAGFIKSDISEEQDGSEYRYGLRYGEFVAPLIQAVKDQQAIIEDLQARIVALENA